LFVVFLLYFLANITFENLLSNFLAECHYHTFLRMNFPIKYTPATRTSSPLTVNCTADSRLTQIPLLSFQPAQKAAGWSSMFYNSIVYSNAISIFSKQWKPSVRPLSTISIRIYSTKWKIRCSKSRDRTRQWSVSSESSGRHRRESLSLLSSHLHCFHYESGSKDYLTEEIHPSEKKRANPAWPADRSISRIKLRRVAMRCENHHVRFLRQLWLQEASSFL